MSDNLIHLDDLLADSSRKKEYKEVKKRRKALFNNCCAYCGKHEEKITIDHFIPKRLGGTNEEKNLIPACLQCNSSKGSSIPHGWILRQDFFNLDRYVKVLLATDFAATNTEETPPEFEGVLTKALSLCGII